MNVDEQAFERRTKAVFDESVERVDLRVRSRLTQARHAALDAASIAKPRSPLAFWAPAAGVAAALVIAIGLWVGHVPLDSVSAISENRSGLEDLEMVASNEPLELLQDDIEFYDWIDNSTTQESAGVG